MKKENRNKTVDQLTVAKMIADKYNINLSSVITIIEEEQKITMEFVRSGYKVIKKNYVTFTPIKKKGYRMKSSLDGKEYDIPERTIVKSSIGLGFKSYVSNNTSKMPDRICRFVDSDERKAQKPQEPHLKERKNNDNKQNSGKKN